MLFETYKKHMNVFPYGNTHYNIYMSMFALQKF